MTATVQRPGHTVLASADSDAFTSLRRRPTSRQERKAIGKALRHEVPRSSLGEWRPPPGRPDPIQLIMDSHVGRVAWADPDPGGPDGDQPVRLPAGHRDRDGRGCRRAAGHRDHAGDLRRRAPRQLRLLRLARGRARDRPERLRRGPPRLLGVGPAPAGRQHLGGRPGERVDRGGVRRLSPGLCGGVPVRGAVPGRAAAADAVVQPAGRRPAARDRDREEPARRDRALGETSPQPNQRPRAAPVHRRASRRVPTDRRGATADHPAAGCRGRRARGRAGQVPGDDRPALAPGAGRLHDARRRAQGGRGGQRRAPGVRRAARRQQPRRRGVLAAEAGPALRAGEVRPR